MKDIKDKFENLKDKAEGEIKVSQRGRFICVIAQTIDIPTS